MEIPPGPRLALLLVGGYDAMVSEVVAELTRRGHPGLTPANELAMRSIDAGAGNAAALARRLGVSRQAAAKSIDTLEGLGYVERVADAVDARRKDLKVTSRGHEAQSIGAGVFDAIRARWAAQIGVRRLEALEADLEAVLGADRGPGATYS